MFFCDDTWETLLKRKGKWQTFFTFLEKISSWACLLGLGLKLIFHWKAQCFILARLLLNFAFMITESWITEKRKVLSEKMLILEDKAPTKL